MQTRNLNFEQYTKQRNYPSSKTTVSLEICRANKNSQLQNPKGQINSIIRSRKDVHMECIMRYEQLLLKFQQLQGLYILQQSRLKFLQKLSKGLKKILANQKLSSAKQSSLVIAKSVQIQRVAGELGSLRRRIQQLEQVNFLLKKQNKNLSLRNEQLQALLKESQQKVEHLGLTINQINQRHKLELDQLSIRSEQKLSSVKRMQEFQLQKSREIQQRQMRVQIQQNQKLKKIIAELQAKLRKAQSEREDFQRQQFSKFNNLNSLYLEECTQKSNQKIQYDRNLDQLNKEIASLRAMLQQRQNRYKQALASLNYQLSEKDRVIAELLKKLGQLQVDLQASLALNKTLKKENADLKQQLSQLRNKLAQLASKQSQEGSLNKDLADKIYLLELQLNQLKLANDKLNDTIKSLNSRLKQLEDQNEDLRRKVKHYRQLCQQQQSSVNRLTQLKIQLQSQIQQLKRRLKLANQENDALNSKLSELAREKENLGRELGSSKAQIQRLRNLLQENRIKLQTSKNEPRCDQQQHRSLKKLMGEYNDRVIFLQNQYNCLAMYYKQKIKEVDYWKLMAIDKGADLLKADNQALLLQITTLKLEYMQIKSSNLALSIQNEAKNKQLQVLRMHLNQKAAIVQNDCLNQQKMKTLYTQTRILKTRIFWLQKKLAEALLAGEDKLAQSQKLIFEVVKNVQVID